MEIEKRFNRILSIFIQLQSKPIIRAQDLAEKYEVSIRTIYRDIKALENAGVPIYSEAGVGYSLASGYNLPPTLFTQEEAMSFAVAEKLMQQNLDKHVAQNFSAALSKMRSVLRTEQKEKVQHLDDNVWLVGKPHVFNAAVPDAIAKILEAIASKKQVELNYKKLENANSEKRIVEPIGVFQEFDFWYLLAHCNLRNDIRQFRIDRIQSIVALHSPIQNKLKPLQYYLSAKDNAINQLEVAHVWVAANARKFMDRDKAQYRFKEEKLVNDGYIMQFYFNPVLNYLIRWLCMYADSIKILQPKSMHTEMISYLKDSYEKMRIQ